VLIPRSSSRAGRREKGGGSFWRPYRRCAILLRRRPRGIRPTSRKRRPSGGFFSSSPHVGVGVGVGVGDGVDKIALTVPAASSSFLSWTRAERLGGAGRGGLRGGKLAGSHTERCGPVNA
jgi:hypothetical protein